MSQDRQSGAEANRFGRDYGFKLMSLLGAQKVKAGSNECILDGKRVSIHSARKSTKSIGVTKLCLKRLDSVLGAFEQHDGSFLILQLPADQFEKNARPTRSHGPSSGRVVLVRRAVFEREGTRVKTVLADELAG